MKQNIKIRAIIIYQDKLLCARHKIYKGLLEKASTSWALPGGTLEPSESLINGLKREILEETGVNAKVGNLLYIQQFNYQQETYLEFFFHVFNSDEFLDIDLNKTFHGYLEIAEIGFVDPKKTFLLPKFLSSEAIATHVKSNNPPKIFSYL